MNLENVSNIKKLYILRAAIDMVKQGIKPDMNIIDACYEDLSKCIADYELILDGYDTPLDGLDSSVGQVSLSTIDKAKKIYGDKLYNKLISELQTLGEKNKKNYICYIVEDLANKNNLLLRVWDEAEMCYVRTYNSKEDLQENLVSDMKTSFSRKKTTKKLSNKKLSNDSDDIKSELG